jgi:hypothetical protein
MQLKLNPKMDGWGAYFQTKIKFGNIIKMINYADVSI